MNLVSLVKQAKTKVISLVEAFHIYFIELYVHFRYPTKPTGSSVALSKKLSGFYYHDIFSEWVIQKFKFEHVIILTNINVEAKNIQFWAKVPQTHATEFLKDIVLLKCKDRTELERLVQNMGVDFAEAYGYSAGVCVITNKDIL
jgi:hypothetical protein